MKILHLVPYTIFAQNYVQGINEIHTEEHIFWIYGSRNNAIGQEIKIPEYNNIYYGNMGAEYEQSRQMFLGLYEQIQMIVFQAIPENERFLQLVVTALRKRPVPFALVPWGRDMFCTSSLYMEPDKERIKRIDAYKKYLLEECRVIVVSEYGYRYLKDHYHMRAKKYFFNSLREFALEEYSSDFSDKNRGEIGILLGHRGTATGRHIEVLSFLNQFETKDFDIICPLSYGEPEYISKVSQRGEKLFGSHFTKLTEWMQRRQYYEFLDQNIDIAIFNNSSSEGGTTMYVLGFLGKKMYINRENENYWCLKEMGLIVHAFAEDEGEIEFKKPLSTEEKAHNKACISHFFSDRNFERNWTAIFEDCGSQKHRPYTYEEEKEDGHQRYFKYSTIFNAQN